MDVMLEAGQLYAIDDPAARALRIEFGDAWVTRPHDRTDHMLRDGDSLPLVRRGVTLVKAYRRTRLSIATGGSVDPPVGA